MAEYTPIGALIGGAAIAETELLRDEAVLAKTEAETAAAQAAAFGGTNNEQVADMVTTEGPTRDAILAISLALSNSPVKLFDIRSYLDVDELIPNDGVVNASPLLQRTIQAASDWVSSQGGAFRTGGIPAQVFVPAGAYRVSTQLVARSKVGMRGEGRNRTVFYPYGNQCFLRGDLWSSEPVGGWTFYDDMLFEDFAVDCINQTAPAYDSGIKAFYIQNLRRARFERLSVLNSWASMYGVDFLIDCSFTDCYGYKAGRGIPDNVVGTGSIFAFGIGRFADESIQLTNCFAEEAGAGGFFFERLTQRSAFLRSPGITMANCRAARNAIGVIDVGSGGIKAVGCDFSFNKNVGWYAGSGGSSTNGSRDGIIDGCTFWRNGGATTGSVLGGHGVVFKGTDVLGGYQIVDSVFLENAGSGVHIVDGAVPESGGLRVDGCSFRRNAYGVHLLSTGMPVDGLIVSDSVFADNTVAALELAGDYTAPQIKGNTFLGSTPVSLKLAAGKRVLNPVVRNNVFIDQTLPIDGLSGYDQTNVKDNVISLTLDKRLAQLAGSSPVVIVEGSSSNSITKAFAPMVINEPYVLYIAYPVAAFAQSGVNLSNAAATNVVSLARNSAATGYAGRSGNASNTLGTATLTTPAVAGTAVAYQRLDGTHIVHENGVTPVTGTVTGWPTNGPVASATKGLGAGYLILFRGSHSEALRNSILAELAAAF